MSDILKDLAEAARIMDTQPVQPGRYALIDGVWYPNHPNADDPANEPPEGWCLVCGGQHGEHMPECEE